MKNVFAVNTQTKVYDGEQDFLARKQEGELKQKQDALTEEVERIKKSVLPPKWLQSAVLMVGGFGLICVFSFLMTPLENDELTFAQAYANAPWVIWAGVPCLLVAAVFFFIITVRVRRTVGSPAYSYAVEQMKKFTADSCAALGIPEDAVACDIFMPAYKIKKNGNRKPANPMAQYVNGEWKIFRDGDDLCFGDSSVVLKIPAHRIGRLVRVNKRAMFVGWNKKTPAGMGEYKKYKIRYNNYGTMSVKPYLSLQLKGEGEWEILFPSYEVETVQRLTGRFVE